MNDTYINYIDQLLDLAERNDIFCLTSRAFNEFSAEVREALEEEDYDLQKMLEQLESYLIDQKRVYFITAKRNDEKSKEMYFRGKVDALSEVQLFIEKLTEEER